jgi:hypothetical protein
VLMCTFVPEVTSRQLRISKISGLSCAMWSRNTPEDYHAWGRRKHTNCAGYGEKCRHTSCNWHHATPFREIFKYTLRSHQK